MAITTMSSRAFNQDLARAKRAAAAGPVFITDRGRPSLVLVTYDDWIRVTGTSTSIADALADALDVAELDVEFETDRTLATGAELD